MPVGVVRLVELQEGGWSYLRPWCQVKGIPGWKKNEWVPRQLVLLRGARCLVAPWVLSRLPRRRLSPLSRVPTGRLRSKRQGINLRSSSP